MNFKHFFDNIQTFKCHNTLIRKEHITVQKRKEKSVMNKIMSAEKKIEKGVVTGYKAIENGVVTGYKSIENGVVKGYKKIEDRFVEAFLPGEAKKEEENDVRN